MVIYRVEHVKDRFGPHVSYKRFGDAWARMFNVYDSRKPSASFEVPVRDCHLWRFGFATLEQLARYFNTNEQKTLGLSGFVIGVYRAPKYLVDDNQAAFLRRSARHIGDIPLGQNPDKCALDLFSQT